MGDKTEPWEHHNWYCWRDEEKKRLHNFERKKKEINKNKSDF